MVASEDIQESIKKLQGSAAWEVKQMEIMSLGHWGVNDPALVPPLINIALNSPHKVLRKSAVGLLGNIGGPKVTETLIMLLLKSPLVTIRFAAAKALGNLKPVDAISYLEAILQDVEEQANVREAVVETLGKIGTKNAMEPLFLILKGKDEQGLQEKVIEILGNSGTKEAIESIISVLGGTLGGKVESVLKELGEPAVLPLVSTLNSQDQQLRETVVKILGEIGNKKAVEPLIAILTDENENEDFLTECIIPALGKLRDNRVVEPLINILYLFCQWPRQLFFFTVSVGKSQPLFSWLPI